MSYIHVTSTRGHALTDYDKILAEIGPEPVAGRTSHVVGEANGSLCVVDVWDSRADADRFAAERLFPAFGRAGISPEPSTTIIAFEEAGRG